MEYENKKILISAYSWESISNSFKYRVWTVFYYQINQDLSIEEEFIVRMIRNCKISTLLIMDY